MNKRLIIIAAVIFFFIILGFFAYNYLEIYKRNRYIDPSREALVNLYHAMELWLKETGHNIRYEVSFNSSRLAEITEKVIIVQSTAFNWRTTDGIKQWIERGGNFVLCLDLSNNSINENLSGFLGSFGITAEYNQPVITPLNRAVEYEDDTDIKEIIENEKDDSVNDEPDKTEYPVFQTRTSLKIENEEDFYLIKDINGITRLAEIIIGDGSLTVLGMPVFMYNYSLIRESNADLAWQLTGGRPEAYNTGILFVRQMDGTSYTPLFAAIFEKGNLIPVIISAAALLIIGFWMVIPVFGLLTKEKINVSRSINDRFNAEIQFLKKHHSLDYYLNIYQREQIRNEENTKEKLYDYKDIVNEIKTAQEKIYGKRIS